MDDVGRFRRAGRTVPTCTPRPGSTAGTARAAAGDRTVAGLPSTVACGYSPGSAWATVADRQRARSGWLSSPRHPEPAYHARVER